MGNLSIQKVILASFNLPQILAKAEQHFNQTMLEPEPDSTLRPKADRDTSDVDGDGDYNEFVTYSEAVAYKLWRSVLMNDQPTFNKVWQWAHNNLQRGNISSVYHWSDAGKNWELMPADRRDNLFAWRYHKNIDSTGRDGVIYYEFISGDIWRDGLDAAADADLIIAQALILANKKWGTGPQNYEYLNHAKKILADAWTKYVRTVANQPYLMAGDKLATANIFNPSYQMPSLARDLAAADPGHDWQRLLVDNGYELITKSSDSKLHDEQGREIIGSKNLAPNWAAINSADGAITDSPWNSNDYISGWDAIRVPLMVGIDYTQNSSRSQARRYHLDRSGTVSDYGPGKFWENEMNQNHKINFGYKINGTPVSDPILDNENFLSDAVYAAYFKLAGNSAVSDDLLNRVMNEYNSSGYWGSNPEDYYGQHFVWFSLALMAGKFNLPATATRHWQLYP